MYITVHDRPVANAGADRVICTGGSVQLLASGGFYYSWSPSAGLSSANIPDPVASPPATVTYTVVVTDQNGCSDSDQITVTVSPTLTAGLSMDADPGLSVCFGDEIIFTVIPVNPGSNPIYQWTVNNLNVGTNSVRYSSTLLSDGDIVSCTLTSSESCIENSPVSVSVVVSVNPVPEINIEASNFRGCPPLVVQFNETSPTSGTYQWDFGDGGMSSERNPTHTYSETGEYDVSITVTSADGCTNTITYNDLVQVYVQPEASFYPDPEVTSIILPEIEFLNSSTGGYVDVCFLGDGDTATVVGGTDFSHIYTEPGRYRVVLYTYTKAGCVDSAMAYVTIRPEYTFYAPNAFTPENIDTEGDNTLFSPKGIGIDPDNYHLYIYDRWGELVFDTDRYDVDPTTGKINHGWDGSVKERSPAPVGVYSWLVIFRDLDGEEHVESGSVTVIR
ncbi:MAG: PKD domain-containing protein [Bacteroidetes bacterium]|nr:PKD domain-containing protein [Bacteroidota bacterium]